MASQHHCRSHHRHSSEHGPHYNRAHHNVDNSADDDNHSPDLYNRGDNGDDRGLHLHKWWTDHDRAHDDYDGGTDHNHHRFHSPDRLMMSSALTKRSRLRRPRRQRGAVLVETALTVPLVFLLIFGIIEFSFMLKDHLTVRAVAQDASRSASVAGDDIIADHRVLQAALETGATLPDGAITKIVVYRANSADAPVPPPCLTAGQSNATYRCNLYLPADLGRPASDFGCDPMLSLDRFWCPADRVVVQSPANGGPPDYVGIYVELERQLLTGAFGATQTLSATYVLRLEPTDL